MGSKADENGEEGDREEIAEVADSMRNKQWVQYLVAMGIGLVVSAVLVASIVSRVFMDSGKLMGGGPQYANSASGVEGFLKETVLPDLEMKYATSEHGEVACKQQGETEKQKEGVYAAKVRCERADAIVKITVEMTHDGQDVDWESRIRETVEQ